MTAPALQLGLGRPSGPPPGTPPAWVPTAAGIALTALLVLLLALGLRPGAEWAIGRRASDSTARPERLTFVDVPPTTLPPPAEPLPAGTKVPTTRQPGAIQAPSTPDIVAPTLPVPGRRVAPTSGMVDSAGTGSGARALPPRAPDARLPEGLTFPLPARTGAPAPACVGPCLGGGAAGVATRAAPLTAAERDSALDALERSIPGLAKEIQRRDAERAPPGSPTDPGAIPQLQGMSIPTGLPGGGPSKAQRERDRRIHAENAAALERIRARQDSIARADSLRKVREKG